MNYKGPKDLESLEYFVHDKLNTETKKVINWENSLMKQLLRRFYSNKMNFKNE